MAKARLPKPARGLDQFFSSKCHKRWDEKKTESLILPWPWAMALPGLSSPLRVRHKHLHRLRVPRRRRELGCESATRSGRDLDRRAPAARLSRADRHRARARRRRDDRGVARGAPVTRRALDRAEARPIVHLGDANARATRDAVQCTRVDE